MTMMVSSSFSSLANTHVLRMFLPLSSTTIPSQSYFPCNVVKVRRNLGFIKVDMPSHASSCLVNQRKGNSNDVDGFVVGCASWSLVSEVERELEAEMNTEVANDDEDSAAAISNGMGRFKHKCGERKGVMEMLECFEREAIMGEDVGKEPMDYNRRARIFDRSSRMFQALKELNHQ